jgi:hypothetical protein
LVFAIPYKLIPSRSAAAFRLGASVAFVSGLGGAVDCVGGDVSPFAMTQKTPNATAVVMKKVAFGIISNHG